MARFLSSSKFKNTQVRSNEIRDFKTKHGVDFKVCTRQTFVSSKCLRVSGEHFFSVWARLSELVGRFIPRFCLVKYLCHSLLYNIDNSKQPQEWINVPLK